MSFIAKFEFESGATVLKLYKEIEGESIEHELELEEDDGKSMNKGKKRRTTLNWEGATEKD